MTTVAPAPTSAQQTASRLPRNLRLALLLGVRAQRTRRYVYPEGIYTARNQQWEPKVKFGTVAIERAAEQLTPAEREYYLVGLCASVDGRPDSPQMQRVLRYSKLLRDLVTSGRDAGMLRRLRLWLRHNLLRKPAPVFTLTKQEQAEQVEVRA